MCMCACACVCLRVCVCVESECEECEESERQSALATERLRASACVRVCVKFYSPQQFLNQLSDWYEIWAIYILSYLICAREKFFYLIFPHLINIGSFRTYIMPLIFDLG